MATSKDSSNLEWEAEKAYIVATSPRNAMLAQQLTKAETESGDDFSFETTEVIPQNQDANMNADRIKEQEQSEHAEPTQIRTEHNTTTSSNQSTQQTEDVNSPTEQDMSIAGSTTEELEEPSTQSSMVMTLSDVGSDGIDLTNGNNEPHMKTTIVADNGIVVDDSLQVTADSDGNFTESVEEEVVSPLTISVTSSSSATGGVIDFAKHHVVQSQSQILVIYGPSGFGKSMLVQKLVYRSPQKFSLAVSHTTRCQKQHEMYARDFYFISKPDMIKKIKEDAFMEYVQIDQAVPIHAGQDYHRQQNCGPHTSTTNLSSTGGDLYGTTWEAFQEALLSNRACVVLNISTKGAEQIQSLGISASYVLLHPGKTPEGCGSIKPNYQISIEDKDKAFGLLEEYALNVATQKDRISSDEDWDRVPNVLLDDHMKSQAVTVKTKALSYRATSFSELLNHFQNSAKVKEQLANIKPESRSVTKFYGPPRINKRLRHERDLVFAIALCKFDEAEPLHARSLSTIYRRLTGSATGSTCLRYGTHWEEIGFQGNDPANDLRGVGMLGVLQMVWLLETQLVQQVAMDVYQYSKEHDQVIPFSVLVLNITGIALQALREGCLSKECNRQDQVVAVINDFTASVLLSFFHTWRKQKRSRMEVGVVLESVGAFAKKHPRFFIHELKDYLANLHKLQLDPTNGEHTQL